MQLTAFIVDDEQHIRQTLCDLLLQFCPEVQVKGTAGNVEEALAALQTYRPDVLFLDVNLGGNASGFDLLDRMHRHNLDVVFITAYAEHAVKAFEYNAVHYLLKPVSHHMLTDTMLRIRKRKESGTLADLQQLTSALQSSLQSAPSRISLSDTNRTEFVAIDDIAYLESKGSYTTFHLADGRQYTRSRNLKYFEDALQEHGRFVRVHKSFIVNKTHIRAYRKNNQYLELFSGVTIPTAIGYRALVAELGDHLIL